MKDNSKTKNIIVKIDTNIFENVSNKQKNKKLNDYLKNNVRGKDYYIDDIKIICNNITIGKLRYGNTLFSKEINKSIRKDLKANIIANLEKVVSYSVIIQEGKKDTKNHKFANEFDRRKTIISYNGQKYEVMFEVGRKDEINTLYGIEHIKRKK